jgi:hypothetical protein
MIDIPTFLTTATSAVGLFDKIADQVKRFIKKDAPATTDPNYKMKIEQQGETLVAKENGVVVQTITAAQLEKLPEDILTHIKTLEKSMKNYYAIWSATYPQLSLLSDPVQKAKVELSLRQEVSFMKNDLQRILKFLEDCGFWLDDHYVGIREALNSYN